MAISLAGTSWGSQSSSGGVLSGLGKLATLGSSVYNAYNKAGGLSGIAYNLQLGSALAERNALEAASAGSGGYTPTVYAPFYDTNAAMTNAKSQATASVGDYYTNEIAKYRSEMERQRALAQEQAQMDKKYVDLFHQTYGQQMADEQKWMQKEVGTGLNTAQQDYFSGQAQSGTQKTYGLQDLHWDIGAGNLTTSGIGRQRLGKFIAEYDTADKTESRKYEAERLALQDFETKTMSQIALDKKNKALEKGQKEEQIALNMKDTLGALAYKLDQGLRGLEEERQSKINTNAQSLYNTSLNNWFATLTNPAEREKAMQTYGYM